jgi:hypothetical protein
MELRNNVKMQARQDSRLHNQIRNLRGPLQSEKQVLKSLSIGEGIQND